jgi:hypothetical protein
MPASINTIANINPITGKLKNDKALFKNSQENDIIILTRECPANMFANSRIPRLIARARYETTSIKVMKGVITKGVPAGKKAEKYLAPWAPKPIKSSALIIEKL